MVRDGGDLADLAAQLLREIRQAEARLSHQRDETAGIDRVGVGIRVSETVERRLAGPRGIHHEGALGRLDAREAAARADRPGPPAGTDCPGRRQGSAG